MENNKKQLFFLFISMFLFFLMTVSAQEELGVFKQNENVQLIQTCSICNYVTLDSVKLPNGTILLYNENMTKEVSTFLFEFNQTALLGEYIYNAFYENWTSPVTFEITATGEKLDTQDAMLYVAILVFLIILLVITGYKIFNSTSIPILLAALSLTYFLLISTVYLSGIIVNNFMSSLTVIGDFLNLTLTILIIGIFPLLIFMIIYMVNLALRKKEENSLLAMGFTSEEAKHYRRK